ncbi:MAG TPA: DNA recombination protein RmuC [Burkholderiales bacterium]|nr:DNA recombination protein RmuC [Burkholderiales bacterium]
MNESIVIALLAAIVGAALAWLIRAASSKAAQATLEARLAAAHTQYEERTFELASLRSEHAACPDVLATEREQRARAEEKAARVPQLEAELGSKGTTVAAHEARIAELTTRIEESARASEEKLALVKQAETALLDAFKALSSDALKSNNQSFLELARTTLEKFQDGAKSDLEARQKAVGELVRPLRESLEKVDGKLGDIEKARVSAYSALNEQLRGLVETHLPMLRSETANLVKALRQPTVRGRWGEIQLKRVVEMAGMIDHCDFYEQETRTTEDGRLRPDLIVRLPGGKQIIVDAKAAVTAYLEAIEAPDEETQRTKLVDHARQVRTHMTQLGRKGYWEQFDPAPEFVVLFLPGEMFFSAALQNDPGLIEFGVNEKVIPATPTTLIALLRAVAYGWRQEAIAKNAHEVAALGRQLYERIAKLAEHWGTVGDRLGKAVDAYNSATGTLETRVLVSARRFRDLHAAAQDSEIEALDVLPQTPRTVQAEELRASLLSDGAG